MTIQLWGGHGNDCGCQRCSPPTHHHQHVVPMPMPMPCHDHHMTPPPVPVPVVPGEGVIVQQLSDAKGNAYCLVSRDPEFANESDVSPSATAIQNMSPEAIDAMAQAVAAALNESPPGAGASALINAILAHVASAHTTTEV